MIKQRDALNTQGRVSEPLISVGKWLFAISSIWLSAMSTAHVQASLIATINKIKWLIVFLYNSAHILRSLPVE